MDEELESGVKIIITNDSGVTTSMSLLGGSSCGAIYGDSEQASLCSVNSNNREEDDEEHRRKEYRQESEEYRHRQTASEHRHKTNGANITASADIEESYSDNRFVVDHRHHIRPRPKDAAHPPRRMDSLLTQRIDSSNNSPSSHLVINSPMLCPLSPVKPMRTENFFRQGSSASFNSASAHHPPSSSDCYINTDHQQSSFKNQHKKGSLSKRKRNQLSSKIRRVRSYNPANNNAMLSSIPVISTTDNSDSEETTEMLLHCDSCGIDEDNCEEKEKDDIKRRIARFRLPFTPMASCPPTPSFLSAPKMGTGLGAASMYGSTELLPQDSDFHTNDADANYWSHETPPRDTSTFSFGEEYENVTLMYAKHEKIPMKDFGSEIRAKMDIDHLLNKAVLLLDLPETSLEEIFSKIIHEMDIQEPEFTSEQVKNALFTQDAGNQFSVRRFATFMIVHILSRTVQSICTTNLGGGTFDFDQTWICALCMLPTVQHRHVAIGRLTHPTNLGRTMQDLRFIIIVIAPSRAKGTKTALETARTFATLFADMDIRQRLVMAQGVEQFRQTMLQAAKELAYEQNQWRERKFSIHLSDAKEQLVGPHRWYLGRGLKDDVLRRIPHYLSDYVDGIRGPKTLSKLFSTIVFLYFACLLPSIAFGVLNHDNTHGAFGVKQAVYAQAIGGLFFAIFGGQPMIILTTTVPIAIYVKIIYAISSDLQQDEPNPDEDNKLFFAMYACVGLWSQFFVLIYASTELSNIMRFATRSTEEVFSLFMAVAFVVEAFKALNSNFKEYYHSAVCDSKTSDGLFLNNDNLTMANVTLSEEDLVCHREISILCILLMFGTLWFGMFLYNFRKTPYLTVRKREMLADYALPMSVMIMSFMGSFCFSDVKIERFEYNSKPLGTIAAVWNLSVGQIFLCMGLGFCLSFLFFMDQNITSAIVNNQQNKLRKGPSTHFDLLIVAMLNICLSIYGLPWMYAALPHSPLHLRALADVEERISQGHVHEVITNVRETRLASIIAHGLILISALVLLPSPLNYIPRSVLEGLFLYMAATSVNGNEMFERILLLFTEQAAYPPTHYIRRVPQRKVHLFTICQLIQLVLLCAFGFAPYPYIEMMFPIVCFCFLPIRHLLIPRLIDYKYLDALDGRH